MFDGITIVVSPLISLMKDQVNSLIQSGVRAAYLNSSLTAAQYEMAISNAARGMYKIIYVAPERLMTGSFLSLASSVKISMLAVDEAHCVSQWGQDFRPSYMKIPEFLSKLPYRPIVSAFTATATAEVKADIIKMLELRDPFTITTGFDRKNLYFGVSHPHDKYSETVRIVEKYKDNCGIIYCSTRKNVESVCEKLCADGYNASRYHAGLSDEERRKNQDDFIFDRVQVMVATNAFGMGIDKPDVRIVIHMDLPDSIEAYFQEAGRAGRDGQKAYAVILYAKADKTTLHKRIPDTFPEKEYIKDVYEHLQYYYQMAMGDGLDCVREFNIEDFCRKFKYFPVPVDSALKILTQAGYLEYTGEQDNTSRLLFTIQRDELYRLREMGDDMDKLIQTVLRSYTGVFTDYTYINEDSLAIRTGLTRRQIYEQLVHLAKLRIVSYIPRKKTPYIIYTRERIEAQLIHISPEIYEERKARYETRINAMLEYVTNDTLCRSRMLLDYFGEKNEHNCGQCDTCIGLRKQTATCQPDREELYEKIHEILSGAPQTPAGLLEQLPIEKELLTEALHRLLDEGKIIVVDGILQIKK